MKTNLRNESPQGAIRKVKNDDFANRLRNARGRESGRAFAAKCGLSPQALSRYEQEGGPLPGVEILRQICSRSGISADYLLGLSEEMLRVRATATATANATATSDAARIVAEVARILAPAKAPVPQTPDAADLTRRLDALDGAVARLASIVADALQKP